MSGAQCDSHVSGAQCDSHVSGAQYDSDTTKLKLNEARASWGQVRGFQEITILYVYLYT